MTKTILITGASSGIGQACAQQAAQQSMHVIATARRVEPLQALSNQYTNIQIIASDLSTEKGQTAIVEAINQPIDCVLNNAALLMPPQSFDELKLNDFRQHMATNVESIVFLTQKLFKSRRFNNDKNNCRILNMSSGATKQAIKGISHYCISKTAALMASQMLKVELNEHNILVNDYFPGVVDTAMQKTLRNANDDVFPFADTFNQYKIDQQLATPQKIASDIITILNNTDDTTFNHEPWEFNR